MLGPDLVAAFARVPDVRSRHGRRAHAWAGPAATLRLLGLASP